MGREGQLRLKFSEVKMFFHLRCKIRGNWIRSSQIPDSGGRPSHSRDDYHRCDTAGRHCSVPVRVQVGGGRSLHGAVASRHAPGRVRRRRAHRDAARRRPAGGQVQVPPLTDRGKQRHHASTMITTLKEKGSFHVSLHTVLSDTATALCFQRFTSYFLLISRCGETDSYCTEDNRTNIVCVLDGGGHCRWKCVNVVVRRS